MREREREREIVQRRAARWITSSSYMTTRAQYLNINPYTRCIVGTVSVKEVTLLKSRYINAGLLTWFLRLSVSNSYRKWLLLFYDCCLIS